jgi:probable rRNA maturation factor
MAPEAQHAHPGQLCAADEAASPMLHVSVSRLEGVELPLPDEWFERIARQVALALQVQEIAEADLLLADDETLHRLNRQFRGVDRPTDVLSFAQRDGDGLLISPPCSYPHVGDVAISVERARAQADMYAHSFEREIGYLFTHGLLHLLGHDHERDADTGAMRTVEEAVLAAVGLARVPPTS